MDMKAVDRAALAFKVGVNEQYLYQCLTGRKAMNPEEAAVSTSAEIAVVIMNATNKQTLDKGLKEAEARADFRLSTDALNFHRVAWRLREEFGGPQEAMMERVKGRICQKRKYDPEEFDAAQKSERPSPIITVRV